MRISFFIIFFTLLFYGFSAISQGSDSLYIKKTNRKWNGIEVEKSYHLIELINGDSLIHETTLYNGALHSKCYKKHINDLIPYSGESITYHENGNVESIFYFENFKRKGKAYSYYENGEPKDTLNFKHGVPFGYHVVRFDNGNIEFAGAYDVKIYDGYIVNSFVGPWEYFYENGQLKMQGTYWFKKVIAYNGEELIEMAKEKGSVALPSYKVDLKHGVWKYWNKEGGLIKIEKYKKGELKSTKDF